VPPRTRGTTGDCFSGSLDQKQGAQLVVAGRNVDATFSGRVDSVEGQGFLPNPTPTKQTYPTLYVAGRKVKTDAGTQMKWSDGATLDGALVKAGDHAYVEGWSQPEGYVEATRLVVDKR